MIKVDSDFGKLVGFTSDRFDYNSYLWEKEGTIILSLINKNPNSVEKGIVATLINQLEEKGFRVSVPTPFPAMKHIITKLGFKPKIINDEMYGQIELWSKP